jgi:EAL domain-containing protein (putative c-di-GMP-specific phosphodiesterase class I)
MRTTAEGVENAAQFEALARIGCTEAQGYYFSRPRPAADIPAMIEQIEGAVSLAS